MSDGLNESPPTQPGIELPAASIQVTASPDAGPGKQNIILTNIDSVPGKKIVEHYGLVSGSIVRAKDVGTDLMANLKNLVGGELKGYTKLLEEARFHAIDRMTEQANALGANAVINIRFATSSVAQGAAELYAYGTAVLVE